MSLFSLQAVIESHSALVRVDATQEQAQILPRTLQILLEQGRYKRDEDATELLEQLNSLLSRIFAPIIEMPRSGVDGESVLVWKVERPSCRTIAFRTRGTYRLVHRTAE